MQKLNASCGAGPDAKSDLRCDACGAKFLKCGDVPGDSRSIAYDVGSGSATTACIRAGSCGGSAASSPAAATGEDYCSGRDLSHSDGD